MDMKTCPSCGSEVPVPAPRCKHCFHDFTSQPKKSNLMVGFFAMLALFGVLGAGTFWYAQERQVKRSTIVDEETKSVVFTEKRVTGLKTDRVSFDQISAVEVKSGGTPNWEVSILTLKGDRLVINASNDESLMSYAKHTAEVIGKPLVEDHAVEVVRPQPLTSPPPAKKP